MWVSFALSFITLLMLIYCPGYIFLSGIGMNGAHALVFAPLFSVVAYSSLALLFSAAGIPSSGILLFCVVISISFVFLSPHDYFANSQTGARLPWIRVLGQSILIILPYMRWSARLL